MCEIKGLVERTRRSRKAWWHMMGLQLRDKIRG